MTKARLALEIYRHFISFLPTSIRFRLKRYIDESQNDWTQIGILQAPLHDTSYDVLLDMHHWHQRWTYVKGYYPEPHITHLLHTDLKEGSVYIDIGANVGVHVVYAASKVGKMGRCFAFEPNPHSFKRLNEQIALNALEHVTTFHTALGNEQGTVTLHGCNDENVGSSIRNNFGDSSGDCEVPLNRADDLLNNIPVNQRGVCKIDVEGFEMQVLLGMTEFIQSHPHIIYIVEATDEWLQATGSSVQELFHFFEHYGYQAHCIDPSQTEPIPVFSPPNLHQFDALFKHNA